MNFPPDWLKRFIKRFLDPYLFNSIYGDLLEDYNSNIKETSRFIAKVKFIKSLIGYFRHYHLLKFSSSKPKNSSMDIWKNYFISSIRNLTRNKQNTTISLIGLTVGFASAIAILQYAYYESTYDNFQKENVYRTTHTFTNASATTENASTFFAAKDAFLEEIPEIENATHYLSVNARVKIGEEIFQNTNSRATTPSFFKIFNFEILKGNVEDLDKPDVIFLSESEAIRYFGRTDVLSELIEIQGVFGQSWEASIAGIFKDIPHNSHMTVDLIIPVNKLISIAEQGNIFGSITFNEIRWRWLSFPTYVQLKYGAVKSSVVNKANKIISENRKIVNEQLNQEHSIWLQPVADIHTTSGILREPTPTNSKKIINFFVIIAMFILGIAWINYINISTARSVTRAKEVGMRKVLGSYKSQLRKQFLFEACLLNLVALFIAGVVLAPVAAYLEQIVNVNFFNGILSNVGLILSFFFMSIAGSFFAGLYPAFSLSNYQVLEVLKGKLKYTNKGRIIRRILVVTQFVFSIFLISALLIVQSQMKFMLNSNLGLNIEQTILVNSPTNLNGQENYSSNMSSFINQLDGIPGIKSTSVSSLAPGIINGWRSSSESRNGEVAGIFVHRALVDEHFINLYQIDLAAGRNLSKSFGSETNSIIINETAVQNLGLVNPEAALNKKLYFAGEEFEIVGIVKDFYQRGVQFAYEPIAFQLDTGLFGQYISVKINTKNINEVLSSIELEYKSIFPGSPYQSRFLDDVFNDQYESEARFRNLFTIFSVVALIIACLGLVGLASFIINQKLKEISVRKVLGAQTYSLFLLLNKEYFVISLISFLITVPLIMSLASYWLDNYENRINIHAGFYLIPLILIIGVVLLTTIGYTLKVINVNPAKTLKEE